MQHVPANLLPTGTNNNNTTSVIWMPLLYAAPIDVALGYQLNSMQSHNGLKSYSSSESERGLVEESESEHHGTRQALDLQNLLSHTPGLSTVQ